MNDERTERVLRLAGARVRVTPDRVARVREAVRREWLDATAQPRRPGKPRAARVLAGLAGIAAGIAVIVAVGVRHNTSRLEAPAAPVAMVQGVSGPSQLAEGAGVQEGAWIDLVPGAGASLRLTDATTVQLDGGTRVRFLSSRVIELSSGGLYIDSGTAGAGVQVKTPFGIARDVGTQFEVRVAGGSLTVRVRSGAVELEHSGGRVSARERTQLTVTAKGIVRSEIAADAPEWNWIRAATPAMEGQTLAAFLERASQAQGWTVRYADPGLQAGARAIVLHGSVNGLSPQQAIAVAVTTSGLGHRIEGNTVVVFRP